MKKSIIAIILLSCLSLVIYATDISGSNNIQSKEQTDKVSLLEQAKSQYELGMSYYLGKDFPQDYTEAIRLFRSAAEVGLSEAQVALAKCYKNGEGVDQNTAEATRLYKLAAVNGNAEAQFNLGIMHYAGEGVPVDFEEGAKYFKLSANQGYVEAMENLGFCYYEGSGVKMDIPESYFWLKLASVLCNEDKKAEYTKAMEIKRAELDQSQIVTIDNKVEDWIESHKNK